MSFCSLCLNRKWSRLHQLDETTLDWSHKLYKLTDNTVYSIRSTKQMTKTETGDNTPEADSKIHGILMCKHDSHHCTCTQWTWLQSTYMYPCMNYWCCAACVHVCLCTRVGEKHEEITTNIKREWWSEGGRMSGSEWEKRCYIIS